MTVFLLIVSILFNFINLFIILIIWKKYSLTDINAIQRAKNDIEDLLIAYTDEMKEDNERIIEMIGKVERSGEEVATEEQKELKTEYTIDLLVNDTVSLENDYTDNQAAENQEDVEVEISEELKAEDEKNGSQVQEAIALSKKGLSHEEIAKKLGKGKGEIELLLKFHKE